ncbi:signal peptidase I [Aestuariirhabdus sp. Z084]|uniref:signal peptidase I n=1 Tax=Aestuariirhabdus haliotis TaxID=2918751 RepID=UPI00201B440A|nr:signal peptidase I [Aestuariirhabdus haliotis]MCL6417152.1 signal peptidase I [Aestuariirhabdus haliotis]MCL6421116.1 signal peptidase I [Aestuariirhabdus haliotis]
MNFPLLLVVLVAMTGLVTLLDKVKLAPARRTRALEQCEQNGQAEMANDVVLEELAKEPGWIETCRSVFPVLLAVLVLRSFLYEPFQIPSGSMKPTLAIGDFILVNKFNYGIRLPVLDTKIISIGEPERGDVMVFREPKNPSVNFIKRVIGLPGDRIRYLDKSVLLNGFPLDKQFVARFSQNGLPYTVMEETHGEHQYSVREDVTPPDPRTQREWVVPEGHYFVMGDNRDHSNDSRYWGFVPEQNIVGEAVAIWMHWPHWGELPSFKNNGAIR